MTGSRVMRTAVALLFTVSGICAAETYKWEVLEPDDALVGHTKAVLAIQKEAARWCSSVMVGPRVMLTAAHCVKKGKVELSTTGLKAHSADCWCPGSWPAQKCKSLPGTWSRTDIAVCLFRTAVTTTVESLSTESSLLQRDARVVLAGFGCISWENCANTEKKYGKPVRAGWARVLNDVSDQDSSFLTIGALTEGESALCPGDSGGPVFVETNGHRKVVGIGRSGCAQGDVGKSEIVSLAAQETVRWLCTWQGNKLERAINGLICAEGAEGTPSPSRTDGATR